MSLKGLENLIGEEPGVRAEQIDGRVAQIPPRRLQKRQHVARAGAISRTQPVDMKRPTNIAPVVLSSSYLIGSPRMGFSMTTLKSLGKSRPAGTRSKFIFFVSVGRRNEALMLDGVRLLAKSFPLLQSGAWLEGSWILAPSPSMVERRTTIAAWRALLRARIQFVLQVPQMQTIVVNVAHEIQKQRRIKSIVVENHILASIHHPEGIVRDFRIMG